MQGIFVDFLTNFAVFAQKSEHIIKEDKKETAKTETKMQNPLDKSVCFGYTIRAAFGRLPDEQTSILKK